MRKSEKQLELSQLPAETVAQGPVIEFQNVNVFFSQCKKKKKKKGLKPS